MSRLNFYTIDVKKSILSNIDKLFKNFEILNIALENNTLVEIVSQTVKTVSLSGIDCDVVQGQSLGNNTNFTVVSENGISNNYGVSISNALWDPKKAIIQCFTESDNTIIYPNIQIDSSNNVHITFTESPHYIRINIIY